MICRGGNCGNLLVLGFSLLGVLVFGLDLRLLCLDWGILVFDVLSLLFAGLMFAWGLWI